MDMYPSFIKEFSDIYSDFSSKKVVVRHLSTLKELREDAVYWIEGTIINVETNREFCYLACRACDKKVEEVDWKKRCLHCGEYTFSNIFRLEDRYNIEVEVADESDTARVILWNKASEKLLGEPAEDVIALYGDTARTMPAEITEKIVGKEGLFELVVSSEGLHVDGFNVSRLTIDEEIKEIYIMKYYPVTNPEEDSFLGTLDYVEIEDRTSNNNVQRGATNDAAAEVDSELTSTRKRQKIE
ncbi:hypothetical protein CASFOL_022564 [Castilleja foliolosa]|uniref:Replication factor A C-terminal domain-containing protein n=1 Tax=Castilleja foliolosa TaxID=1961234 RepID=A0ABD3CWF6_9LAMI